MICSKVLLAIYYTIYTKSASSTMGIAFTLIFKSLKHIAFYFDTPSPPTGV